MSKCRPEISEFIESFGVIFYQPLLKIWGMILDEETPSRELDSKGREMGEK